MAHGRSDSARRGHPRSFALRRRPPIPPAQASRAAELLHHRVELRLRERGTLEVTEPICLLQVGLEVDDAGPEPASAGSVEHRLAVVGARVASIRQIQYVELASRLAEERRQQEQATGVTKASGLSFEGDRPEPALSVEAVHR